MTLAYRHDEMLSRLQRALPLLARGRPPLLAFLRARRIIAGGSPRLKIVGVLRAQPGGALMCLFVIEDRMSDQSCVAPLGEFALERGPSLDGRGPRAAPGGA